jgi:hypothetical protein
MSRVGQDLDLELTADLFDESTRFRQSLTAPPRYIARSHAALTGEPSHHADRNTQYSASLIT